MTKVVLNDVLSTYDITSINDNFVRISDALNYKVLYREAIEDTSNTMSMPLDMNGRRIINVPTPTGPNDLVRVKDLGSINTVESSVVSNVAIADQDLPALSLIYVKSTGNVALASAVAEGKEAVGFVLNSVSSGLDATYYMTGSIITGLSGLIPGTSYYLSTSPGLFVPYSGAPTSVGNVFMKIGTAITTNKLIFGPEAPITL